MLSVIVLSVIVLSVIVLSVVMLNVIMLNAVMLNDIQHNNTHHNDIQHIDTRHNKTQHYDTHHNMSYLFLAYEIIEEKQRNLIILVTWGIFTKLHFLRNLQMSPISKSVCSWQTFPYLCKVAL